MEFTVYTNSDSSASIILTYRYFFQGYHVERRFGWDCHGLPVEYEIDKTLGIKGPEDVEKMGIDKYNAECRKIVMKYANEWETIITRMGRWIGNFFIFIQLIIFYNIQLYLVVFACGEIMNLLGFKYLYS